MSNMIWLSDLLLFSIIVLYVIYSNLKTTTKHAMTCDGDGNGGTLTSSGLLRSIVANWLDARTTTHNLLPLWIANFLGEDRRVTAAIVDDTPSVLGVDASQRITVDSGGGDSVPWQGAMAAAMTRTYAVAAWLCVVLVASGFIVKWEYTVRQTMWCMWYIFLRCRWCGMSFGLKFNQ